MNWGFFVIATSSLGYLMSGERVEAGVIYGPELCSTSVFRRIGTLLV